MAAMTMLASLSLVQTGTHKEIDWWGDRNEPDNKGRRAQKDALALAKAATKRQRRAVKRLTARHPIQNKHPES